MRGVLSSERFWVNSSAGETDFLQLKGWGFRKYIVKYIMYVSFFDSVYTPMELLYVDYFFLLSIDKID